MHAAQGQTHDRVIAVLDTGAGPLVNQQTLYVQMSRAREEAVVLTDNREQLIETLEANTGERLTALEAIGETVGDRAPAKRAVDAAAATAFLDALRAERAERAFVALPAAGLDDRQALRDRLAAAELAAESAREVPAAMDAARQAAVPAGRAPPFDDDAVEAARTVAAGARTRVDAYRSLMSVLSAAEKASGRLAPGDALRDRDIDEASMERHGAAAREAAAVFDELAQSAHAAGEAALAAGAEERASNLGLDEQYWAYRLAECRYALAVRAEREMAPPQTVGDVRAWRELRKRQADARAEGAATAEAVAVTHDRLGKGADATVPWRKQAVTYRKQAGTIRDTLPALDELEKRVETAAAAPQDVAAWRAAAAAAETIMRSSGQGLRDRALDARGEALLHEFGEAAEARAEDREALNREERRKNVREHCDNLRARWDEFEENLRAQGRVAFAEGLLIAPFIEQARELAVDPDLDGEAKDGLRQFLHEHDVVQPDVARRCKDLSARWEDIRTRAKARYIVPHAMPESSEVVEEMRALAADHPAHLTPERTKAFEDTVAAYDRLRRQSQQELTRGRGMSP